jgi:hypothetical protein
MTIFMPVFILFFYRLRKNKIPKRIEMHVNAYLKYTQFCLKKKEVIYCVNILSKKKTDWIIHRNYHLQESLLMTCKPS